MEDRCIACGLVIEAGWLRMMTPLGQLCIPDSVPEYRVRVGNTVHHVIAWTSELLERINDYQQSREAFSLRRPA